MKKVITVAVDTPLFPENLLKELYKKMEESNSDIVFAASITEQKKERICIQFLVYGKPISKTI